KTAFDNRTKRNTRKRPFRLRHLEALAIKHLNLGNAFLGGLRIFFFALKPDEMTAKTTRCRTGGPGTKERIKHNVALTGRCQKNALQECFGFLGRMDLFTLFI